MTLFASTHRRQHSNTLHPLLSITKCSESGDSDAVRPHMSADPVAALAIAATARGPEPDIAFEKRTGLGMRGLSTFFCPA